MNHSSIGSTDGGFEESVSISVITAVAARRGVEPTELPPLYEWIDPDALDSLFEPTRTGGPRGGRVSFVYDGHDIVVAFDEGLEITVDGTKTEISAAEPAAPALESDEFRFGV
ncbi:HalOD1 output domain-containing protein [Halopiger xanaduensis]|uniref:Halobacterial output domain-containing protein n=1 Tax=Halopiger xanaduensis (strain DSM 18323 / JCM 14033 / SH-6) TaxID=797210 RepID=F8DAB6_HALXS|nr:HalOD1 output domain-containing protein [Halopiger xanaduensis]AEH38199.1 hypothetical protein Halxa_3589 [Halopiger xanaduensis SH-6]